MPLERVATKPECESVSRIWDLLKRSEHLAAMEPDSGAKPVALARIPGSLDRIPIESVRVRPEARIAVYSDPRGAAADRMRFLRMCLNQVWNPEKLRKLLITSALPHDGKSTIALNLAVTLTEEGKRTVLLIEGDLHRATVSKELGLAGHAGVAEYLEEGANPLSLVRKISPLGFYFLPAGTAKGNPGELLKKELLAPMIESLSRHFDWILIDSPPVAPLTDTLSWKDNCDATLLVVRAERTPTQAVEDALNLIGRKHVLAIVLNAVEGVDRLYAKYYKAYTTGALPPK